MARKLRIEFEGALYHVINRGNYRRDVFATRGACEAFLRALAEAVRRYGWQLYAFVLMRNHYHLAVETPQANLVDGMHWFQSTLATRFNRLRRERGHLFQGRYQSIVLEDFAVLARVVDYIHLNPVRASVVAPEQVSEYSWSSLRRFRQGPRLPGMAAREWLRIHGGLRDDAAGWRDYEEHLVSLAKDAEEQKRQGLQNMSHGWALGTSGWRRAIAQDHAHLALAPGLAKEQSRDLKEAVWQRRLEKALARRRKGHEALQTRPMKAAWKLALARDMREAGASTVWIAEHLCLGSPVSVRSYLCRDAAKQQTTA